MGCEFRKNNVIRSFEFHRLQQTAVDIMLYMQEKKSCIAPLLKGNNKEEFDEKCEVNLLLV